MHRHSLTHTLTHTHTHKHTQSRHINNNYNNNNNNNRKAGFGHLQGIHCCYYVIKRDLSQYCNNVVFLLCHAGM